MAGLGEYEGTGDYSAVHAKKSPFLLAQSVSQNSPLKIIPILAALLGAGGGGAAAAGGAVAAKTAVGAAIKGIGAKLASTKVGAAITKGAKWIGKKIIKPVKSLFTKKPVIGDVSKTVGKKAGEISVKTAGKGPQWTSGASKSQISTIQKPPSFTEIASKTTKVEPSTTRSVLDPIKPDVTASTKKTSVIGDYLKSQKEKLKSSFSKENLLAKGKEKLIGSVQQSDAEAQLQAQQLQASAGSTIANLPTIGDTSGSVGEEEELKSVLSFKAPPFRMRGWSPFTKREELHSQTMRGKVTEMISTMPGLSTTESYIKKYS